MAYPPTQELETNPLSEGGLISLDPAKEEDPDAITLEDPNDPIIPLPPEEVQDRANKANMGLGKHSPGIPALQNAITTGKENFTREQAAKSIDTERRQKIIQHIEQSVKEGKRLTPEEVKVYLQIPPVNPGTVFEASFADAYFAKMLQEAQALSPELKKEIQADPERAKVMLTGTARIAARDQAVHKFYKDEEAKKDKEMSWGSWGWDLAEQMIPLQSSRRKAADSNISSVLQSGESIEKDRRTFWAILDNDKAMEWFKNRFESIKANNRLDALDWARQMSSMSTDDKLIMNTIDALDLQTIGSVGVAAGKAAILGAGGKALRRFLKGSMDGIADGTYDPAKASTAAGDVETAAKTTARKVLVQNDPLMVSQDMADRVPLVMNPSTINNGLDKPNLSQEFTNRLIDRLKNRAIAATDAIMTPYRASRGTPEAIDAGIQRAAELIKAENRGINDSVISIRKILQGNTWHAEAIIGKTDGTLFRTIDEAENYAQNILKLPLDRYQVVKEDISTLSANRTPWASHLEDPTKVTQFKTAQGSVYKVNADGTTTRNKAARKEHPGDSGVKETSARTVYVSKHDAQALAPISEANWRYLVKGETISLISRTHERPWRLVGQFSSDVTYHTTPQKGMVPVELWQTSKLMGGDSYKKVHFGNEITEITSKKDGMLSYVPQGQGWYVRITKPVDETEDVFRSLLTTTYNTNPPTIANIFLARRRTAEDTLAEMQRGNRHIVTHVPQAIFKVFKELAKDIHALDKKSGKRLQEILEVNRDFMLNTTGERGIAYKNQAELERAWQSKHGQLPSFKESQAYWAYHQMMDIDWMVRNIGVWRDYVRQGIELQTLKIGDNTAEFKGKFVDSFDWNMKDNAGILVVDADGTSRHLFKFDVGADTKKELDRMSDAGYRWVQVGNHTDFPLKDVAGTGHPIHFVLSKNTSSRPLPFKLVDYNPGVHVIYPQSNFIKQAIVQTVSLGKNHYFGDKTILAADSPKEAAKWASALEDIRIALRREAANQADRTTTDAAVDAVIKKSGLPETGEYWRSMFLTKKDKETFLSLEHPIGATVHNKSLLDHNPELPLKYWPGEDLVREDQSHLNLSRTIDMGFLGERNGPLETIQGKPSLWPKERPIYELTKARTLDPYVALERSLGNSVRKLIDGDAKTSAIEQWARQYAKLFENPEAVMQNPHQAFFSNKAFDKGTREEQISATVTRERIKSFIGSQSEFDRDVNHYHQKVLDLLSGSKLDNAISAITGKPASLTRFYNDHELRTVKDPVGFTRSIALHVNFGFFNIAQFPIQAAGMAHAIAVAGPDVGQRAAQWTMYQKAGLSLTTDPATIRRYAQMAEQSTGIKAAHFEEAWKIQNEIGFRIIGREHALDTWDFNPELWKKGLISKGLDKGLWFFKQGELFTRQTAFNAAYIEWRRANPDKIIDQFDIQQLMNRSSTMSSDMTRASHSKSQEGLEAIPMVYLTFSQRMLEQFWGGRIGTWKEKALIYGMHSAIWGVPLTAGIGVPWPIYEQIRQYYVMNGNQAALEHPVMRLFMEGGFGLLANYVTGKEFNLTQRYSPAWSDLIRRALNADDRDGLLLVEALGGAMGSVVANQLRAAFPLGIGTFLSHIGQDQTFTYTKDDFFRMFEEIKAIKNINNAWLAYTTGKYMTKTGRLMTDELDAKDAAALLIGGTPKSILDARAFESGIAGLRNNQRRIEQVYQREMRLYLQYADQKNWDAAETHLKNANIAIQIGGWQDHEILQLQMRAFEQNSTAVQSVREKMLQQGTKDQIRNRLRNLYGIE